MPIFLYFYVGATTFKKAPEGCCRTRIIKCRITVILSRRSALRMLVLSLWALHQLSGMTTIPGSREFFTSDLTHSARSWIGGEPSG
ncbi:hypothetical protein [Bradyrhizobium sp. USDA 3315]